MQTVVRTKLPIGQILGIKLMEDGSYEVIQNVLEREELEDENLENMLVLIKASELSLEDLFMKHIPTTSSEKAIKCALELAIKNGLKDF